MKTKPSKTFWICRDETLDDGSYTLFFKKPFFVYGGWVNESGEAVDIRGTYTGIKLKPGQQKQYRLVEVTSRKK